THADFELVPRGDSGRRIRRQHEISARKCLDLLDTDRVIGYRHRDDSQRPVEIVGHDVLQVALYAVRVDDPGPVRYGLVSFAPERIEVATQSAFPVASRCRVESAAAQLGQDEIEYLRRRDIQRALLEE